MFSFLWNCLQIAFNFVVDTIIEFAVSVFIDVSSSAI